MQILELRPYDPAIDEPHNGWDYDAVGRAQKAGRELFVDQCNDIWTGGRREYIGKIRKGDAE
ncbi:MAG: hypothetical protein Q4F83_12485 [Eubacteriales bacterium]|nr:hypothetical protein [Eubacteriales bacterium]